jgi:hypothetical protein
VKKSESQWGKPYFVSLSGLSLKDNLAMLEKVAHADRYVRRTVYTPHHAPTAIYTDPLGSLHKRRLRRYVRESPRQNWVYATQVVCMKTRHQASACDTKPFTNP